MFYSKEILARKDTQLGLIWLAATLGPRSGIKKLSKKDVNGVNIVKSCKDISQPVEPFALRFSSNLMVGVTRVYSQQYNFYYSDVNNTWMRLKRDLAAVQSENLYMTNPGAKIDAITFGYDLTIEHDLVRPVNIIQNYEIEVAVSDERRRKITLEERPGMAGVGPGAEFDAINAGFADDMLMGDDDGLYIDAEGNLRADMPEQGFTIGDDGSILSGFPETPAIGKSLGRYSGEESIQDERTVPENSSIFDDILMDNRDQDMPFDAEMDGEAGQVAKRHRSGSRQRKPVGLATDEKTILSEEDLKAFRDNYAHDQAKIIRDREAKATLTSAKAHIDRSLFQPLGITGFGTDLGNFWSIAATHELDNVRMDRRGDVLPIEQPRNARPIFARSTREQSWLPGDEDPLFMDEVPEPERARRLTNPPSSGTPAGASIGTGGFGLDSVSSKGGPLPWEKEALGRSVGGRSERSSDSNHPWQDFDAAFDQGTGTGSLFPRRRRTGSLDSRSSAESGTARGARTFEGLGEEEDEPLIRRRRHQSILVQTRTPSRDSARGRQPLFFGGVSGEMAEDVGGGGGTGATQERLALERATANFLGYTRSLLKPLNVTSFSFEDIIAPHRRKDVAAAAFYHILALSTMGVMRPKQDVSYKDIQVELLG
ncbi:hypothetical protein BGZ96_000566 [Linnemannia gamsii]|uniref:Rad21/Rec8-like protein N-terminal domain-containing protein n=1 Tax=Linnemannia gamsii TaxID=64522 RepID=A0ABQ7KAM4_9FUNG|nr:hypothetical protein BGZ96_000566 [Linnemannia gamsii]